MNRGLLVGVLTVLTTVMFSAGEAGAQAGSSTAVPRMQWGAPDLQGVWDFRSLTPMERPEDLSGSEA